MKFNKWTVGLAAVGVVSLASAARADEKMSSLQTALSNTTISGYVDTAATWRPGTDQNTLSGGANVPSYSFAKNDGFSLNAVDIAIDKPEDDSPWAAGYHVEWMVGPDSVVAGTGIRQAYVTLRTPVGNGLDWKVGVWDTIVGYESNSDPLNPNYTRSYAYTMEPTTHTGVLATYKINDMVTIQAGIADGSNVAGGPGGVNGVSAIESQKAYMGDVQFTAPDSAGWAKGATMTMAIIDSAGQGAADPGSTSFYAGMTLPTPVSMLKIGSCFDYLDIHNGHITGNNGNDSVWNIAFYSTIQATDKLSFNLRAEYLSTADISAGDATTIFGSGVYGKNTAEELTATVQYNLWANVISRAEVRWDHTEHFNGFGANPAGAAFRNNDFLLALNLIYQF
ncbi:MAG: outer membrane beta-barrel protein [Verrucomicrobiota bacterium]|jgi:hypothetical protein